MSTWQALAAANNAEWCDLVARAHGASTAFDADAWTSRTRTPPFYPDAVTLVAEPALPELLARIDASPGCSIKDSFCSIDLLPYGFEVLFEGRWIVCTAPPSPAPEAAGRWHVIRDPEALAAWEQAWAGDEAATGLFRPELLDQPAVAFLAAREAGRVVAGAVLNRSGDVAGLTNFFADPGSARGAWRDCVAFAATVFPGTALAGYVTAGTDGTAGTEPRPEGFDTVGALRVWIHPSSGG